VVELCKLTDRKAREATKKFRFDGIKLLEEAIKNRVEVESIFVKESRRREICDLLEREDGGDVFGKETALYVLTDDLFDKISEEKSPEGVICCAKYIDKFQKNITIYNSADFLRMKNERIVLLESVRDPSNIGAIIRSAAAIGVDRLIVSADCADVYHPRAVRASMGTLFNQPIDRVTDLPSTIAGLRASGRRVFAAALDERAEILGSFPIQAGDCVVIGNEGHGLTAETIQACDTCVMIPMTDRAESFNAAVAASILMWEFFGTGKNNF
jgi:TrmH family RNA methyltransferase